ncbi:MAG TPA: hypothetical protein VGH29_04395, partial [Candidatus Binataceae bacterium]
MAPQARVSADIRSKGVSNNPSIIVAGADITRPPTRREQIGDRLFRRCTHVFAWLTVLLVVYVVIR